MAAAISLAAPAVAPVRGEIDALLAALQASNCEFNRNGSWHGPAEARTHLLQKLEAVEKRTAVRNTEQFIEMAASSSSASGQAYQVRCNGTVQPSARWFAGQLEKIRASGSSGAQSGTK